MVCLSMLSRSADATVVYALDDGVSETVLGVDTAGDDLFIANLFEAQAGGQLIAAVRIAFGSPATSLGAPPPGLPFEIILYDDPNDDGDISDRVRLTSTHGVVSQPGTDQFVNFGISQTTVTGWFAVGVYFSALPGVLRPIAGDSTFPQGRTLGVQDNVDPDLDELFDVPANAFIRAVSTSAHDIPEPPTWLLIVAGGLLLAATHGRGGSPPRT
jgi:hypothetical protein